MSYDPEKAAGPSSLKKSSVDSFEKSLEDHSGTAELLSQKLGFLHKMAVFLNAETKGVDLITDEEKTDDSILNAATMWWSANLVIATFSLGALGITVFGLDFWTSVLTIIFFSLLGVLPVAFFSTFGPKLGLRQMILSKFLMGNYAMRIFALINLVACVGWGAVNIMALAQLLHIVNNGTLPPWAGCLIIVVLTIFVSLCGYHVIHIYEKWSWIPNAVAFIAIIARMSISKNFTFGHMVGGANTAGSVFSFGGAVFGFATGWTTYASDYTVYQPRNANATRIFFGILVGLWVPLLFTLILGAACATGTLTDEVWAKNWEENSVGGLVYSILVVDSLHGFGQFLCVLLALSTVANNVPNMYSMALSSQAFWSPLARIPRVAWSLVGNFATLAISIPAYYKFDSFMSQFMSLVSYYLAIYLSICLSEHFIHNKGDFAAYDYEHYKDPSIYSKGIAGIFAFCCGVAGVVVGMAQEWYVGVLGRKIGEHGGDIGFELAFAFAFIGYNLVRPFEKKYTGR
ncbi:purine-cytosine permease [Suhomyces tanzawaensis NRRL Y-17324]|uniref:Purine-cytosine permease n=1 Tax=Suhomyces tanzawaensis NRRL Y-17324 TaxID=984487 RepID=A0A1E4SS51_9ASCO|nr:purine-cytosine permease [Suhomyces tanzawaensis NRRL Y-17324]ODV82340.1 purine-cytosine permease [Suhomyces tanzawaensis NRRL Y-17324]